VYVGNLSYHTSWQDLKDLFKEVGTVLHADVMMEEDGRSKGCGLVKFATPRDASRAIAELHDAELDGRKIFVREDRETAGGAGCKLYVGNLSFETTWMELKDHFREAGAVVRADVAVDKEGASKGFGTVEMGTTRDAAKAIQLFKDKEFNGRMLDVRPDAFA